MNETKQQPKVVLLDRSSLYPDDLDFSLWDQLGIDLVCFDRTSSSETQQRIAGADVIITNKVVLDRALLQSAKSLKLVIIQATGTNNIDLDAAKDLGIQVCNMVDYSTESVAQYVLMAMLQFARSFPAYHQAVQQGMWQQADQFCLLDFSIMELSNKTLGLIGYGAIAKRVEALAKAFNMNVLIAQSLTNNQPDERRLPLSDVLMQSDFVSIHCPLSDVSRNLIAEKELALMKSNALLINSARGGIVNEAALLEALQQRLIGGAVLDVLEQEPPAEDSLLLNIALDNLWITPHCAWGSVESRQAIVEQTFHLLEAYLKQGYVEQQRVV